MVILSVYSESKRVHFKAHLFSKACMLNALLILLVVLCPLLIAFRSQGFWIKINSYDEWPTVNFKHKFLFCALLENDHLFWSSYDFLNRAENRHLRPIILTSRQEDSDRDGRKDTLCITIKIPVTKNETIKSIKSFFIFDYRLEVYSKLRMEILIPVEFLIEPTGEASVVGDIKFVQKVPLLNHGFDNRYNVPLVTDPLEEEEPYYDRGQNTLNYENLLSSYLKRDFLCKLENVHVFYRIGRMDATKNEFLINLRIRYTKDRFEYKTGFWELMKWAWIQYLSLLLIFVFFAKRIRSFVFGSNLLHVVEDVK
uniref:Transmembrane protein 231 n=1 Tax=Romanomermis culicivorax TaxID=13658 RepID=A0A915J8A7_ROMCU